MDKLKRYDSPTGIMDECGDGDFLKRSEVQKALKGLAKKWRLNEEYALNSKDTKSWRLIHTCRCDIEKLIKED